MSMDHLMDDFWENILKEYHEMDNSSFDKEEDFIQETVKRFRGKSTHSAAGSVTTTARSVHQSPRVRYDLDNGKTVTRELADILYVVNSNYPSGSHETRAMLSQAKFAKSPPSWDLDLYQYDLIHRLPEFTVVSPRTYEDFDLSSLNHTSFANFVMASRFSDPFYLSSERMDEAVSNYNLATDNATFNPDRYHSDPKPTPYEYSKSILKRLVRRTYGQRVRAGTEVDRLIDHLSDIVNGSYTTKSKPRTDGGSNEIDNLATFAIIEIDVELDQNIE
jgi:hypothetical protein